MKHTLKIFLVLGVVVLCLSSIDGEMPPLGSTAMADTCMVGGVISTDTTWSTAQCDTYVVYGNLLVLPGAKLTIMPGVVIAFKKDYRLEVAGALTARGTASDSVIFTGWQSTQTPNWWDYIKFRNSSIDTACSLLYCRIEYADYGVHCDTASPTISHSLIRKCNAGVYCFGGSPYIVQNTLVEHRDYGLSVTHGSPVTFGNVIGQNNYGIRVDPYYVNTPVSLTITADTIRQNVYGIYVPYSYNMLVSATIRLCEIYENGGGGIYAYLYYSGSKVRVTNSYIHDNTASKGGGIYVYRGFALIDSNCISGNWATGTAPTAGGIYFNQVDSAKVQYNDIVANSNAPIGIYEVYSGTPSSPPIHGEYNWWGTTDSGAIANLIYDYYDNFDLRPFIFTPFADSAHPNCEMIKVTAPNGGEILCSDSLYEITWYWRGSIDNVAIGYSIDGGLSWIPITASTSNDGSYSWTVPETPSPSCKVKVRDAYDDYPWDESDSVFTIKVCDCVDPEHFVFTTTDESYSIVIDSAFLDGFELEECDEIGVFDDTGGGLLCVGASVYHPDDLPIPLTAWKDDPLTNVKDGYAPGDTMYFRVWSRNQNREECAHASYSIGNGRFEFGEYSKLWLEAPCECESIPLHSGWQWISTAVDPDPCKIESVFVNCWDGHLDIVIACDGSFCIPGIGCWIDSLNVLEMYKLHMSDACTIQVCGSRVPTDTPIPLLAGWGCIAYFPECPLEPETALVSIWENLDIVKNDDGEFCIPGVGCWIECMEYNEGYKLHLSCDDTLVYPTSCPPCPPPYAKRNSFPGFAKTAHFSYLGNTGESYSIVVNSVELGEKHPEVGDEIGIFTSSGLCVGAGVWQGELLGIAVWQDDDRTDVVDGFIIGEQMIFRLWDNSENKEIELCASFEKGDGRFGADTYALVNLKSISTQPPKEFKLAQNYPNPFNPETIIQFSIPHPTNVKIEIVNILGQMVATLVDEHRESGSYQVRWDGTDSQGNTVANGIYLYRLVTEQRTIVKKMLLIK